MSERLSSQRFDRLADNIWHLGQISMRHLFEIAPVPTAVKGELYYDDFCLEPEFLLDRPYPEVLKVLPRSVGITVNELEPYEKDTDFTMYTYQKVVLDIGRRTRQFGRGVMILDDSGNTLTPALDRPSIGKRKRPGTAAWREVSSAADTTVFGDPEYEYFMSRIDRATQQIYHDILDEKE